jgi:hypothetical protein
MCAQLKRTEGPVALPNEMHGATVARDWSTSNELAGMTSRGGERIVTACAVWTQVDADGCWRGGYQRGTGIFVEREHGRLTGTGNAARVTVRELGVLAMPRKLRTTSVNVKELPPSSCAASGRAGHNHM